MKLVSSRKDASSELTSKSKRLLVGPELRDLDWESEDQARLDELLRPAAEVFAARCRTAPHPKRFHDLVRRSQLLYARGLGLDESKAFMRALDNALVTVRPDGGFFIPGARACSPNLHLLGREMDHVKLHTEVLIHIGAYAELVLDHGWDPALLVFDPFMSGAALDLWGFDEPPNNGWSEGTIVFAAEAKSRVAGADGLNAFMRSLRLREREPNAPIGQNHAAKWNELIRLAARCPLQLLLAADGARWWFTAELVRGTIRLTDN